MSNYGGADQFLDADPSRVRTSEIHWKASANTDSNPVIRLGFWSVGVMMLVFILWSVLFPLSSAVITPGTFVSEGKNKYVQHSSGGRVRQIFIREGDQVEEDEPILELDNTQAQAELTRIEARHASLQALKARLDAERSGGIRKMQAPRFKLGKTPLRGASADTSDIFIPNAPDLLIAKHSAPLSLLRGTGSMHLPEPLAPLEPGILLAGSRSTDLTTTASVSKPEAMPAGFSANDELMESQREAYRSGRKLLAQEIEALEKKSETLEKQKDGLAARAEAQRALLEMAEKDYQRLQPLARQGYIARNKLNDRERAVLELKSSVTALELDIIGVENQIGEVSIQIEKARVENSNVASKEYSKIVGELAELSDALIAARAAVTGSIVRAPASGTLLRLSTNTVGGVIGAGDKIAEIVPVDAPLVVQARVSPSDIDYVQVGQEAEIAVTAFNRRIDDSLDGRVAYKSADAEKDEKTGDPYFTVRLELKASDGKGRSRFGDIQAGMQGEVYIHTGSRTFMTYLAKPMIDSFRRAFREQ